MTASFVYFIRAGAYVKVGVSNEPQRRLSQLQVAHAEDLALLGLVECVNHRHALRVEREVHSLFRDAYVRGEWFEIEDARVVRALGSYGTEREFAAKRSKQQVRLLEGAFGL